MGSVNLYGLMWGIYGFLIYLKFWVAVKHVLVAIFWCSGFKMNVMLMVSSWLSLKILPLRFCYVNGNPTCSCGYLLMFWSDDLCFNCCFEYALHVKYWRVVWKWDISARVWFEKKIWFNLVIIELELLIKSNFSIIMLYSKSLNMFELKYWNW